MPLAFIDISVISAVISLGAACAAAYFASRPTSTRLEADFQDVLGVLEKVLKDQKSARMKNVRAYGSSIEGVAGASQEHAAGSTLQDSTARKQELRRKFYNQKMNGASANVHT